MKWRHISKAAGLLAAGILVVSCGSSNGTSSGSPSSGASGAVDTTAILRGTVEPIKVLDPVRTIDPCNAAPLAGIYDTLIRTTQKGEMEPGLATSWKTEDPTTFVVTLKQGVKFQDGTPFNADAVVAHIKRAMTDTRSTLTGQVDFVQSVKARDDHTVEFDLKEPRAGILTAELTGLLGMVPSPKAVEAKGDDYGVQGAVGAGPWKATSFQPSQVLSVRTWPGYFDPDHRKLAGIDYQRAGSGQGEQLIPQQVQNGQLDIASVKDSQIPQVKSMGLTYVATPSDQYAELFINFGKAPFNKLKVREALEYALDRPALSQALTAGSGTVASQPVPASSWAYNPELKDMYPYNPTKAKQLLAEAGYPDGIEFEVAMIQHDYYQRMAQAVQDMLKKSNIRIKLVPVEGSQINDVLYTSKKFSAAVTAYAGNDDPGQTLETKFSKDGSNNPSHVETAGLDKLLDQGAAATSQAERAKYYQQANELIMKQALSVPLYFNSGVSIHSPKVKNVVVGPTTCHEGNYNQSPPVYIAK